MRGTSCTPAQQKYASSLTARCACAQDISPSARFCVSEADIIAKLYNGIVRLMMEESRARVERGPFKNW